MNGTDISGVGRTSRWESEEERQEINESTCGVKEAPQLLDQKQAIVRREGLKSETERGVIALNALSPIKRLSNDVLCHIFELHCKDSLPVTFPLDHEVWGLAPPQITLSRVCSAWREIMLDVPTFWRSVRIVPGDFDTQALVSAVKVANTWLSRAKGLPCSIDIDFPEDDSWDSESFWEKDWHKNIIRNLISLHKFKKLGVTFARHHLRDLLELPDDKLSCVEGLCVRYRPDEGGETSPLDLHKLSNLTSFSLLPEPFYDYAYSDPSEGYSDFAGLPWHNLRHIHICAIVPVPFCLDALAHCSAVLETCSLAINGESRDHTFTFSPRVPVHLSQLRQLQVIVCSSFRYDEILESFLLSLRFPRSSSLTLGFLDDPLISIDLEIIMMVQNASQMHLEELIIEELIIPDSTLNVDVRTLMTAFPSLRRINRRNWQGGPLLHEACPSSVQDCCPQVVFYPQRTVHTA
ncbi:hypothetical protein M378DRAFT_27268 [Amanita muscaria Koide BX008]|uniref:F-box domain-containing protein n=1 Tax=Amanita muscaria (strain Koide BX008) TaxID=946122 RepID=A0A0C2S882_AMAMK|nr:hypothetical protein M378DRAFT_27268 [Amanita muscaria Koide BX008]